MKTLKIVSGETFCCPRCGYSEGNNNASNIKSDAIEVLLFLNAKSGKKFRAVDVNLTPILARLKSGISVESLKMIIAFKNREWGGTDMAQYLRPSTLFNATKCEQYLGEIDVDDSVDNS